MNTAIIINELERNKLIFKDLLENLPEEIYLWRPAVNKWCLLEIVCHLHDEEREDFRARVKHVLETPKLPAGPIDPVGWVTARKYMEQDFIIVLQNFLKERDISVDWLKKLNDPKWDNVYKHPLLGNISAGTFFTNWLAHDYLHIRQITKTKYQYLQFNTGEDLSYAGEW